MDFLPFTKPDIDEATIAGVGEVLRSGWITSGPQVMAFEAALSGLLGGRTVRCFSSGTATLEVGLRLADVGAGDEVLTTPLSWVATANVALEVGARPVFVDVDPRTRNLDLDLAEKAITKKTKAIIPVDLTGRPAKSTGMIALVFFVIAFSARSRSRLRVRGSTSTKTGRAPTSSATLAVATQESGVVRTSSPAPTSASRRPTSSVAVPELKQRTVRPPRSPDSAASNAFTCGPEVIQPERSTSPTPAIVASSISGLVNGRKSMVWKKLG